MDECFNRIPGNLYPSDQLDYPDGQKLKAFMTWFRRERRGHIQLGYEAVTSGGRILSDTERVWYQTLDVWSEYQGRKEVLEIIDLVKGLLPTEWFLEEFYVLDDPSGWYHGVGVIKGTTDKDFSPEVLFFMKIKGGNLMSATASKVTSCSRQWVEATALGRSGLFLETALGTIGVSTLATDWKKYLGQAGWSGSLECFYDPTDAPRPTSWQRLGKGHLHDHGTASWRRRGEYTASGTCYCTSMSIAGATEDPSGVDQLQGTGELARCRCGVN